MPPHISGNFADVLDPDFQEIFEFTLREIPDMLPDLYDMPGSNGQDHMNFSDVGAVPDFEPFSGSVSYADAAQGFDSQLAFVEFARGIQVERKLFDDDQHQIFMDRPRGLARAAHRRRQIDGARMFNMADSVDTFFGFNSENVALASASHLTNAAGVSTATGFSNISTAPLTRASVAAGRIQMIGFRDDIGGRIEIEPDELLVPPDLEQIAFEITESRLAPENATNAENFHRNRYNVKMWRHLSSTTNWFLMDSQMRRQFLKWVDRIPVEFAMVEDFDTLVAKWRGYMRYAAMWLNWRFILCGMVT